jgi:hypothetical protein
MILSAFVLLSAGIIIVDSFKRVQENKKDVSR